MNEQSMYAPFVMHVFEKCLGQINANMADIAKLGNTVTPENVLDMAGLRGQVITPLVLMMAAMKQPELVSSVGLNPETFTERMSTTSRILADMALSIDAIIGEREPVPATFTTPHDEPHPLRRYAMQAVDLSLNLIAMCRKEIDGEGAITSEANVIRIHAANSALSSILLCVCEVAEAPAMLKTIGHDAAELKKHFLEYNDYARQTQKRINTALGL